MLQVVNSLEPWVFSELLKICSESLRIHPETVNMNFELSVADMHKVRSYYEDLTLFFQEDKGKLFLWEEEGEFVSVCRVESEQRYCVLHDLETKPNARRKGNGKKLLTATISYLEDFGCDKIVVHVKKSNRQSLALHTEVGFTKVKDTAHLLDGTVSTSYMTMEYDII